MKRKLIPNLLFFILILLLSSCDNNPLIRYQEKIYQVSGLIEVDSTFDTTWTDQKNAKYITTFETNLRKSPDIKSETILHLKKDGFFVIDTLGQYWVKIIALDSISGYITKDQLLEGVIQYKQPNSFIVEYFIDEIVNWFPSVHRYWILAILAIIGAILFYYIYQSQIEATTKNNIAFYSWAIFLSISGIISLFTSPEIFGFNAIFIILLLLSLIFSFIQVKKYNAAMGDILRKYFLLPLVIITSFVLGQVFFIVVVIGAIIIFGILSADKGSNSKIANAFSSTTKATSGKPKTVETKYICKYCGLESTWLKSLTSNPCSNSPTGKHVPFEGGIRSKYICKHCGQESTWLKSLTSNPCSNSPTGKHQPLK